MVDVAPSAGTERRSRRPHGIAAATAVLALVSVVAIGLPVAADSVTTTIAVAGGASTGNNVAISPDGSTVYVARPTASISAIDTSGNTATSIPTSSIPISVVVSPDGARLYATLSSSVVQVIDTATKASLGTIPVGASAAGLTISADGSRLYTANAGGSVSVITTATNAVTTFAVTNARNLIVSPDGSRLYVGQFSAIAHNVLVFDTVTNALVSTIVTPGAGNTGAVMGFAFSPDGTRLYGDTRGAGTIIIDTATNTLVGTVPTGTNNVTAGGVAVTPDGTRAYATNSTSGTVSVIDLATNSITATIPVGAAPNGIDITPDGLHAYVNNATAGTVSVIAIDTFPTITTTTLPAGTYGASYSATIATTGSPAPQVTVTAGSLPPGLALAPATGALTGTPTAAGSFTFTVTASSTVSGIPSTAAQSYTVVIAPVPPSAPLSLTAISNAPDIDLAWTAADTGGSPITGYRIERSVGGGPFASLVTDTASPATTYTDSAVTPGETYSYRAFAITAVGASGASNTADATATAFPAITTTTLPDGGYGTPYSATVTTTGFPAPQVTVTGGALPPGLDLDPVTGALTGIPTAAGSFTFTVTAASTVDGAPSTATQSYTIAIAAVPPSPPLSLTATVDGPDIDLTWTAPTSTGGSPLTGYRIERSVSGGAFAVLVADTGSTATGYTDAAVTRGRAYAYRVFALTADGAGAASNVATATVPATSTSAADPGTGGAPLANTGVDPSGWGGAAAVLIVLGLGLLVGVGSNRRRRGCGAPTTGTHA